MRKIFCGTLVVFAGIHAQAQLLSENFSTLTDNTLPAGWTSSKSSDLDYTTEPYVGAAGPAYKFATSGQWLQSPTFETGATGLQFWAYGNAGSGSTITVSGLVSGAWALINAFSIAQSDGTYTVALNSQVTQLKFSFTKVVNCAFDDLVVTGGGASSNSPPVLNAIGNKSIALSNSLQFAVTAVPTDGDAVTLTASNLPSGAVFYPTNESGSFVWPNATPTGTYSVTFNAADNDGADAETITITVSPQTPPILTPIGNLSVTVSNSLQFAVTATPTEGDAVTLTASNLPSGASFYPTNEAGSFVWPIAAPTGTYSVTFNAADNDGADAETITITVNPAGSGGGEGSLDISGWTVVQTNALVTYTIPAGTTAEPNSYIVLGRYATKEAFEAAWGITLSNNVVYINTTNKMPQINGAEMYAIYNTSSLLVDGFTPSSLNPLNNTIQRTTLGGNASDAGNWSSSAMANATPGTGASGNGTAGLRISEYSDASNWSNEFVELYYDASTTLPSNQPPVLAAIGNKTVEELQQLQFTVSATDLADGDTITLTMSNAPAMAVFATTNGNGTFTWALPTPDGVYTTTFYAADKDGVDSETITVTVTPPSATITSNFWHFEDDWQGWTNYSRASGDNWSRVNFPGAESTAWKMEMNGVSSDDWLISPALNLSAVTDPIITYWTKRDDSDITIQVKVSTNYPGTGDPLASASWATLPYTTPASINVWAAHTNSLNAYIGQEQVYIAFHYYSANKATLWSVDQIRYSATAAAASNAPPVLAPIGNKSLVISNNLMFPVQAVDPVDGDPITITVSNMPAGAEFTNDNGNAYFTWVSASPDGVYTTTFHAADKDGFDAETINITVSLPPGPTNLPVLASIGNKSIIESNALQFSVSASDVDGDTITLSASGLPSGAGFGSTNAIGSFNWPNPTPVGVYTTTFYAADNDGTNSETVIIFVNALAPTGTIVFQGFDGQPKDTWGFTGGGSTLASAARTDGYGRQIGGTESLTFSNVSLVGHFFSMLHIHCASTGGVENFDSLKVYVALDGGAFPDDPDVTIQEGNPTDAVYNVTWPYSASGIASAMAGTQTVFYGDGDSGYSTIRIKIPDGHSSVSVKIVNGANVSNEYYHIDDVELTSGSWNFNDPPVLSPIGGQYGTKGASLIFTVSATDSDGDPITLSATNLPSGSVFVDLGNGSGNFTWANPTSMGTWNPIFTAETADGWDSETVQISIGDSASSSNVSLTIMAANISDGASQAYDAAGIRTFQGLKPDVVCIQEFNYSSGLRTLVDTAFSTGHYYYCEGGSEQIPNGIISKYPIISSGEWEDTYVSNRDFAWAIIDIPGTQDLYVVSLHILTSSSTDRNNEATLLRSYITNNWPANILLAIAGDFNTVNRSEVCLTTLSSLVTDDKQPRDQNGDMDTEAALPRDYDYDYVLPSTLLNAKHTTTIVSGVSFPYGIVFDPRLSAWGSSLPSPVLSTDADTMQHLAVMKTFQLESAPAAVTSATIYTISGAGGAISPANPVVNFGQSKSFSISNSTGYTISDVKIDGVSIGVTNAYTFTGVTNAHSIAATFQADASWSLVIKDLNGPNSGSTTNNVGGGSSQRCTNNNLTVTYGTTQFVLKGWAGTGSAPASGTSNVTASFTMSQDSSVIWLWNTSYWFDSSSAANGSVNTGDQWVPSGSNVTITATPNQYYNFSVWTGNPPSGQQSNNPVTVAMTSPKALTANFIERLATNNVPEWWLASYGWTSGFDTNAMWDHDGDGAQTWKEYYAGTIPTNAASKFSVQVTPKIGAPTQAILTWSSATGRTYYVEVKSNVVTDTWAPYLSNVPATPPLNTHTGTWTTTDRVYFRIEVRKP
ncbi:MAG: hypothetical protein AB7T27_08475 [Kiritimatiellia bacterium]